MPVGKVVGQSGQWSTTDNRSRYYVLAFIERVE
jgi:hypothetical protein